MHAGVCEHMHEACTCRFGAYACMCMHALGFLWPFFSKNSLFVQPHWNPKGTVIAIVGLILPAPST